MICNRAQVQRNLEVAAREKDDGCFPARSANPRQDVLHESESRRILRSALSGSASDRDGDESLVGVHSHVARGPVVMARDCPDASALNDTRGKLSAMIGVWGQTTTGGRVEG